MSDYWGTITDDVEAERFTAQVEQARVAAASVWPFVAEASTMDEYRDRMALADERLVTAVKSVVGGDTAAHLAVYPQVVASFDTDFETLKRAREAEAREAAARQRVANTHDRRLRGRRAAGLTRRTAYSDVGIYWVSADGLDTEGPFANFGEAEEYNLRAEMEENSIGEVLVGRVDSNGTFLYGSQPTASRTATYGTGTPKVEPGQVYFVNGVYTKVTSVHGDTAKVVHLDGTKDSIPISTLLKNASRRQASFPSCPSCGGAVVSNSVTTCPHCSARLYPEPNGDGFVTTDDMVERGLLNRASRRTASRRKEGEVGEWNGRPVLYVDAFALQPGDVIAMNSPNVVTETAESPTGAVYNVYVDGHRGGYRYRAGDTVGIIAGPTLDYCIDMGVAPEPQFTYGLTASRRTATERFDSNRYHEERGLSVGDHGPWVVRCRDCGLDGSGYTDLPDPCPECGSSNVEVLTQAQSDADWAAYSRGIDWQEESNGWGAYASRRTAAEGDTCAVCGDKIARDQSNEDPSTWHHDNGEKHDHEAKPADSSKTSRRRTAVSLSNVGIDGDHGVGTTPDGERVKFTLSDKDREDLKAILHSDLSVNFSGVTVDESEIIREGRRRTAAPAGTKAIRIGADKSVTEITLGEGIGDLQQAVGGYFEVVSLSFGDLWINEEARMYGLPFNSIATDVCGLGGAPHILLQGILGDAVLTGPPSSNGDTTSVTEAGRKAVGRVAREASLTPRTAYLTWDDRDIERGFAAGKAGDERLPGKAHEWLIAYDVAERGGTLDEAFEEAAEAWDAEDAAYGGFSNFGSRRRTASSGVTCIDCGGEVENVLEGFGEIQICDACVAAHPGPISDASQNLNDWVDSLPAENRVHVPDSWLDR